MSQRCIPQTEKRREFVLKMNRERPMLFEEKDPSLLVQRAIDALKRCERSSDAAKQSDRSCKKVNERSIASGAYGTETNSRFTRPTSAPVSRKPAYFQHSHTSHLMRRDAGSMLRSEQSQKEYTQISIDSPFEPTVTSKRQYRITKSVSATTVRFLEEAKPVRQSSVTKPKNLSIKPKQPQSASSIPSSSKEMAGAISILQKSKVNSFWQREQERQNRLKERTKQRMKEIKSIPILQGVALFSSPPELEVRTNMPSTFRKRPQTAPSRIRQDPIQVSYVSDELDINIQDLERLSIHSFDQM